MKEKLKTKKILRKLFELNKKNLNKKNDNLNKILSNKNLIIIAYQNLQVSQKFILKKMQNNFVNSNI